MGNSPGFKVLVSDVRYTDPERSVKKRGGSQVKIDVCGSLTILRNAKSNAYVGSLGRETTTVIKELMKYETRLSGKAQPPKPLELLIHSRLDDAGRIGDYLSDSGWFLQEPDPCDRSATYHNPQWLLRPGIEEIPSYQQGLARSKHAPDLSTSEMSEITILLDSATGPSTFKPAQVSKLLKTELKRYLTIFYAA